ncbi:hypothetical protein D9757_008308 [Collybiopsis confluens]|uniref:Peroxisomal ATPase PEX6 n=1 Tax=Collybiopsis confluens TaxID=2823264 RepID=A0A8H5M0N2_9AGAR|nr:hypothetical protein D9757_008308 [Collybiopsis confluens]
MSLLFDEREDGITTVFRTHEGSEDDGVELGGSLRVLCESEDAAFIAISSSPSSPSPSLISRVTFDPADGLAIPRPWLSQHRHIFSSGRVFVSPVIPIILTHVYATALSPAAYDAALDNDDLLERLLCTNKRILRQGSIYTTNPLLHGFAESPRFEFRLDMLEPVLQGYADPASTTLILMAPDDSENTDVVDSLTQSSDEESFEIDEDFLANSVVYPSYHPVSPVSALPDGKRVDESTTDRLFKFRPLTNVLSTLHDDHTLYLRIADLGRLGVLSVKAVANDVAVPMQYHTHGSPILLHNLARENHSSAVSLQPSSFGSREPPIPIAHSVTIARVASPLSINKMYQKSFLDALKSHFSLRKRLVKQGDLVAVSIDTDLVMKREEEWQDSDRYPATPPRTNQVVFFMITNIEYNVPPTDSKNPAVDTYFGSTAGELGCWFDPESTRMVQAGVDHSFVPDVGTYLSSSPSLSVSECGNSVQKLLSISSVVLERRAVDHSLQLSVLLKGARGIGKFTAALLVSRHLGLHILEVNCYDIIGENDIKTEAQLRARFENAIACSPSMLVLRHLEAFAQSTQTSENGKEPVIVNALRDCVQAAHHTWKMSGYPVIICGTTSMIESVPIGLLSCFKHEVSFEAPDEQRRHILLEYLLQDLLVSPDVSVHHLAQQTAAFLPGDLRDLITRAEAAAVKRVIDFRDVGESSAFSAGVSLTNADFDQALARARASYSESIGAPKIPSVSWDDVGGLPKVKADILDTIQLPLDHPELFADGLKKRSGILLYGPPGTGKTLVAKAVATSFSLNFFSIKGPELLNMYIGESEANVRRVFQRARDAKPCVIFFDELDSIAPKRGNQGDSGGVMDRIVSQLLAELDGSGSTADVFVIGATNRPDLLDTALLRPGRQVYIILYEDLELMCQADSIVCSLTRKFRLYPGLDLRQVAEQCSFNYTGADFYALCSDALLNAMSRKAEELEDKLGE